MPLYVIGSSVLIFLLLCVVLFGKAGSDSNEQEAVAPPVESVKDAKLRTAEFAKQRQIAKIAGLEGQLSTLRRSLAAAEAEKAAHATRVKAYAMDHKMAIAALGITVAGAGVALEDNGNFTEDQKTVAGVSAVVAGLYVLANGEECAEVTDRMAKAATMQSDYETRIKALRGKVSVLQSQIAREKRLLK
jgi:hypothetical protein